MNETTVYKFRYISPNTGKFTKPGNWPLRLDITYGVLNIESHAKGCVNDLKAILPEDSNIPLESALEKIMRAAASLVGERIDFYSDLAFFHWLDAWGLEQMVEFGRSPVSIGPVEFCRTFELIGLDKLVEAYSEKDLNRIYTIHQDLMLATSMYHTQFETEQVAEDYKRRSEKIVQKSLSERARKAAQARHKPHEYERAQVIQKCEELREFDHFKNGSRASLGRKICEQMDLTVTPETVDRWLKHHLKSK